MRHALEQFDHALQHKLGDSQLSATFGQYCSPLMPFVLLGSLGVGGVGLVLWLLGFEWAAEVPLIAIGALGLLTSIGVLILVVLSMLDVGRSAAEVVCDALREADTVRRRQTLPEAGQLAFAGHQTGGALSNAEAEAGRVTIVVPEHGDALVPPRRIQSGPVVESSDA